MRDVLHSLNKELGVKGSLILTTDGVVVASEVGATLNSEQVAAIASDSIQRINRSLREIEAREFSRFMFNSTYGKMVFMDTGGAYLVVVLDKGINVDLTVLAVASAARKIRTMSSN